jgi:hypothetical protein
LIEAVRTMPNRTLLPAIVMTGDGAVAELASMARLQGNAEQLPRTRLLHKPVKTVDLLRVMDECVVGTQSFD